MVLAMIKSYINSDKNLELSPFSVGKHYTTERMLFKVSVLYVSFLFSSRMPDILFQTQCILSSFPMLVSLLVFLLRKKIWTF